MPLTCQICSQFDDECNEIDVPSWLTTTKSEVFDDSAQLRSHLIEEHSKFVAESLLAPNIHDKTHVWLLANVDYSANAAQMIQQENVEETENNGHQQDTGIQQDEDDVSQNGLDYNNGGDPIEVLLNGIFGGNGSAAVAAELEEPSTSGETQQFPVTIGQGEENEKLDFFGTALKSFLISVSADSPLSDDSTTTNAPPSSCRASMVDSKAIRKAHCQVCKLDICSTARQRHVYMVHLKKKDLFKCPRCEYTNSNSVWEVQKHSRVQHGKDARPISQEEKHKLEIQMWSQLCFPEWKQKRKIDGDSAEEEATVKRRKESGDGGTEVDDLLEGFGELLGHLLQQSEDNSPMGGENVGEEEPLIVQEGQEDEWQHSEGRDNDNASPSSTTQQMTPIDDCAGGNDRLCHLCMEESKYPGRHIAQRHLKRPLYECPICCKFGSYESCTVSKHIHKVHPKEAKNTVPISNLDKYADEIRELQAPTRCFPNRQMKLVRPANNSGKARPRERHQCGVCSADVAQSDRQRHVFHKHLRKGKIFECPLCDFSSNYDIHRVKWHIKWDHKEFVDVAGGAQFEPISHESLYRDEIDALNDKCFPGWQRKRHLNAGDAGERKSETPTMKSSDEQRPEDWGAKILGEEVMTKNGHDVGEEGEPIVKKTTLDDLLMEMVGTHQHYSWGDSSGTDERARSLAELDGAANALEWTCQICHTALKPGTNLLRHVAKDHLNLPLYQCPICENHGAHSAYEVRSHMLRSHADTTQEPLSSLEENLGEIELIYRRCFPRKEFKAGGGGGGGDRCSQETSVARQTTIDEARVRCRECGQEMKTEDRQIHVYRHHLREPRLYECPACDFSHYACSSDVRNHILRAHKNQTELMPRANLLRYSRQIAEWNERCFPGWINRRLPASVTEDFNSCRLCGMDVRQTSRHIAEHHLHIPLHQCPLCEYGAAEARLVQRHMRNNHTLKECEGLEPIANVEKHRGEFSELHNQCFPGRPKRLSNITIADESRRAKCRGCAQTISKKRRLLHLLEKHLKKPIYKCKYCLFTSTHDKMTVETHQKEKHFGKTPHVLTTISRHKVELKRMATECFNEPELKLEE
uniref:C2H2-type domain-containing protein n=1 Tax=Globodera pallida TaxID=36090 RepID=A0A183CJL7_GLOPA